MSEAAAQDSVLGDQWVQMFGVLALVSGGFSLYARARPSSPSGAAFSAVAAVSEASALDRKTPGRLLVDARLATDADTADLGQALAEARAGEIVYVRPGVYRVSAAVSQDQRVVGLGGKPEAVVLEGAADAPVLTIKAGAVKLSGLTLQHGLYGAVALSGAKLELEDVLSQGNRRCGVGVGRGGAARLRGGAMTMNDYGVCADAGADVDVQDAQLSGNLRGLACDAKETTCPIFGR